MPEFATFTVKLRGQEFTRATGHTMRFVRAQGDAGVMPEAPESMKGLKEGDDLPLDVQDYLPKFTNWQRVFVRSYYLLVDEMVEDCSAAEIVTAFAAITEAAQRDPFGQLP